MRQRAAPFFTVKMRCLPKKSIRWVAANKEVRIPGFDCEAGMPGRNGVRQPENEKFVPENGVSITIVNFK